MVKAEIISPRFFLAARRREVVSVLILFAASKDLGLMASLGHKSQNGNRKDGVKDGG